MTINNKANPNAFAQRTRRQIASFRQNPYLQIARAVSIFNDFPRGRHSTVQSHRLCVHGRACEQ